MHAPRLAAIVLGATFSLAAIQSSSANEFERAAKAVKKAGEQAKTNAENAKENVKDNYDRVEDQTKVTQPI